VHGLHKQDNVYASLFHELLESNLPDQEKTTPRLAAEAVSLLFAGTETTAWGEWETKSVDCSNFH
jgi:hypothetical protein